MYVFFFWGGGGGGKNMFLQCGTFTRALQTENLKALLFHGPVGVGVSNDWYITVCLLKSFIGSVLILCFCTGNHTSR